MKKRAIINKVEMGRRLRELREEFGHQYRLEATQDMIADIGQIHRTGYNAVENGKGGISQNALCRIIEFYRSKGIDASLDWIILGINIKSENKSVTEKDIEISQLKKRNALLTETLAAQNKLINKN